MECFVGISDQHYGAVKQIGVAGFAFLVDRIVCEQCCYFAVTCQNAQCTICVEMDRHGLASSLRSNVAASLSFAAWSGVWKRRETIMFTMVTDHGTL